MGNIHFLSSRHALVEDGELVHGFFFGFMGTLNLTSKVFTSLAVPST